MGGEVRPEIQSLRVPAPGPAARAQVDNLKACIELEHTTWKINEQSGQSYSPATPTWRRPSG